MDSSLTLSEADQVAATNTEGKLCPWPKVTSILTAIAQGLDVLPSEIHLKIFDILRDDPETSACLGLTCQKLYPLFFARHKKANLYRICNMCGDPLAWHAKGCRGCTNTGEDWKPLYKLLEDWTPPVLKFADVANKFVGPEWVARMRKHCKGADGSRPLCGESQLMLGKGWLVCMSCSVEMARRYTVHG